VDKSARKPLKITALFVMPTRRFPIPLRIKSISRCLIL
jgi:hypothetical protein